VSGLGKAIREHMRDFVAIAALLVIGLITTGVILSEQGAKLPSWVPGLGSDRFQLRAELSTAQAVVPGQGQTVNIAGIDVGKVAGVELENGVGVVEMDLENEYAELVHSDATLLVRPRTGLQDMTLELQTGSKGEPVEEGFTVPLANTQPNINPDQILASLDADTRGFLTLLLEAGGKGIGPNGEKLSAVFRRFEPLARDLKRISGGLAERRAAIARSITNFGKLSEQLASSDTRLADFVSSSNAALDAFANQEANIRSSLQELPSALAETRRALESGDRLALELGPASERLIPTARSLGPALRESRPFFRKTLDPIKTQIRPFTRQVDTPVRHLRQLADELNKTTPPLRQGVGEVNKLFNALAFDPPGAAESYLFYLGWLNHNGNAILSLQDAHGPIVRGMVLQSCGTAQLAEGNASVRPFLRTLQLLSNVPSQLTICPLDPQ
jgi:phospholipid/cholesterol/gamma-HCH transport system substrate-binding protein